MHPDLIHGLPRWRESLQDDVIEYVLNFKDVVFKTARILDLGCGLGYTLARLSRLLPSGARVVGIDINEDAVTEAEAIVRRDGDRSKVQVRTMNAEKTSFTDECFDVVIANMSFSVFTEPGKVASEVFRVLKLKGRLIATEVNKLSLIGKIGELIDAIKGTLYYNLYSPNELIRIFISHGFRLNNVVKMPLEIQFMNRRARLPFRIAPLYLADCYRSRSTQARGRR